MKKHLYKFFLIFLILISCCKKEENYVKIIKSKILISKSGGNKDPISGTWVYYNEKENPFMDITYYENNDSLLHYEVKIRDSNNEILFFCENKNGKIIKQYLKNDEEISKSNGELIYRNNCYNCHHFTLNSIGRSMIDLSIYKFVKGR